MSSAPGVVRGIDLFDRATAILCLCGQEVMVVRWAVTMPEGEHGRGAIDRECPRCQLAITIEVEA